MQRNETHSNRTNGRDHATPSAGAQRGYDEYDRDDRGFEASSDLRDTRYVQRRSFGGYADNGRAYDDAREFNGGRASEGGFVGDPAWTRDDRRVMGSRYGYDDDRRFGPSGHEPQRFDHDRDDGRWGRDHDYNPYYHHHHSYSRGYEAGLRDAHRPDPRRDDPQAGRSAFEEPFGRHFHEPQRRRR